MAFLTVTLGLLEICAVSILVVVTAAVVASALVALAVIYTLAVEILG